MKIGFWGGKPNRTQAERAQSARELGYDGVAIGRGSLPDGVNTSDVDLDAIRRTYAEAFV
jgi:hypothetical protein